MESLFRNIRHLIAAEQFESLHSIGISKPAGFNWVTEVFEAINVKDHPDDCALRWTDGPNTEEYTFSAMACRCNQLLNFLRRHGINQQDVVFAQLPLVPANWMVYLAAMKGGLRLIPAATILTVSDIRYRFEKLTPRVVIADPENAAKIDAALGTQPMADLLRIIVGGERPGWHPFEEIDQEPVNANAAETKPDDPLFLFFTSGTTGQPKVVTHTQLSYPLGHLTTAAWIGLKPGDLHYNISQPGWAKFAWSSFFAPWNMGAGIFSFNPHGRFVARDQLAMLEKHRITSFCAAPTVLRMLIQEPLSDYAFHLRQCVAAGEPLNPEIIESWKKGTGLLIRDGYGQTESSCLIANPPGARVKFGSMGKPTFLYEMVIADEDGRELPDLEEGFICVKTDTGKPNGLFAGYFDDPQKEKEVFRNGLYYTGDKAYRDEEGYIWFVGRDDDVIKASAYRIGPFEVESVLLEHPAVMESAVVASPHAVRGNEIKAFIILAEGHLPTSTLAKTIFQFCRKNLASYKMPRVIQFVPTLPKTISGKIRRVELRAMEAEKKAKQIIDDGEYFYS